MSRQLSFSFTYDSVCFYTAFGGLTKCLGPTPCCFFPLVALKVIVGFGLLGARHAVVYLGTCLPTSFCTGDGFDRR